MIPWHKPRTISPEKPLYRWTLLANILFSTWMAILSAVATIVANDTIQGELAFSDREAILITTIYLLGVNTVVPAASWFADRFGYKIIYALGIAFFTLSNGIIGLASEFWLIAMMRFIEGIGAGLIFPIGLAKITQNFSKKELPLTLILYAGAVFGGGIALGLPLSGYLTQFFSWRWIFDLFFFFGIGALLSCWLVHEETPRQTSSSFDFLGYGCFALFIAALLIGLTYGPLPSTEGGWRSPYVMGCLITAGSCLIFALFIELRHPAPLIPIVLFKDPLFSASCALMFLLGMGLFGTLALTIDYLYHVLLYEKYVGSQIALTFGFFIVFASALSNFLMKKIAPPFLSFTGLALLIASYFLNNYLNWKTGPDQIFWILTLRGLGIGFSLGPVTIYALEKVPKVLESKAAMLLTFFRQVGGTYGGVLLALFTIKRKIFHAARFSEQVNQELPGYEATFTKLYSRFFSEVSDKGLLSALQAKAEIAKSLEIQALCQAQNDSLILFGYATSITAFFLLLFILIEEWKKWKGEKTLSF